MTSTSAPGKSTPSASHNVPPASASSSSSAPPPAPRKPQTPRNRSHRSSRRGHSGPGPRYDEDDFAEMKALNSASSRRGQTSITHLLNFAAPVHLDSLNGSNASPYSRSYRKHPTWGPGSGYHAADKARYIHANYRFIVAPTSAYAAQAANADVQIDWAHVWQVLASSISQASACPVCLSDPVAPRMAKCGHIFCLSCVMRYMAALSAEEEDAEKRKLVRGPRWKKCPICDDHVYLHDLRPVRFYAGQESALPKPGEDVVLRLMARSSASTLALPRINFDDQLDAGEAIPWHFGPNVLDYARVMKGSIEYMAEQYDEEIAALQEMERTDGLLYGDSNEWTQKAIASVTQNKAKLAETEISDTATSSPASKSAASSSSVPKRPADSTTTTTTAPHDFFFYSAPPHLYLSPLDIRILKTAFGSFAQFPSTLLPRVEHISTGHAVDDVLRKRAKYLAHLPRGCLISFLECDWSDILPADTLAPFADELHRRRKAVTDKIALEDRQKALAERREKAAALRSHAAPAHGPEYDYIYDDGPQRPPVDMDDFQPLPGTAAGGDMLADDREDCGNSSSTSRTVWGTRAVAGEMGESSTAYSAVDDGWLRDEDLVDVELARQLEQIELAEVGGSSTAGGSGGGGSGGGGGKKKKKQKQKITLMSTGSRRAM
ncbi:hypothetical protein TD95_004055 [Thielaviopsis punctulata]|uniref:RING-type domain-containing protein n=1 Tax=Thielaviopsis punctulata TaxID=72032 RepID=A0A0F4Z9Y1_9PEZI|nr:hypothetical protein TD95_004055 [Thielaviopsis punctulata]